jgi:hypothetical protein
MAEKPECNVEMFYSKNLDMWSLDIRLNKQMENLLNKFKTNETTAYTLPNGQERRRYLFASSFVGSYSNKKDLEKRVLNALFDKENYGKGKRFSYSLDYGGGLTQLAYLKELFKVIARSGAIMNRKVIATIKVVG